MNSYVISTVKYCFWFSNVCSLWELCSMTRVFCCGVFLQPRDRPRSTPGWRTRIWSAVRFWVGSRWSCWVRTSPPSPGWCSLKRHMVRQTDVTESYFFLSLIPLLLLLCDIAYFIYLTVLQFATNFAVVYNITILCTDNIMLFYVFLLDFSYMSISLRIPLQSSKCL